MARRSEDLEIVIGANLDGLRADLAKGAQMARDFAKEVDRASPKPSEFRISVDVRGIQRAALAGREAQASFSGAALGLGKFVGKAAIATGTFVALEAGFDAVGAAVRHVKESVSMAAELEQTTLAFEVMLGSAERAKDMLGDLRKFAAETPFGSRETIDAARQLKAYGIAADQVLPSLRVIGDITAGLGGRTNLSDMAYLFGTLASQGRAFSKDIYQFTNRGVDLLPGLAEQFKVTKAEVMGLVEEGRVGFPEVGKALERLRGPGGQFENLMQRQSKTLAGLVEQAKDAWDLGKVKLGQIVIEEFGLKDIVRDFDSFSKRLTSGMEDIRPVVKFVGDLAKGVANVGFEFGKAGIQSANVFGEMAQQLPWIKDTLSEIQGIVRGMNEFKIDPSAIAKVTTVAAKDILHNASALVITIAELGNAFNKSILQPIKDTVGFMQRATRTFEAAGDAFDVMRSPLNAGGIAGKALVDLGDKYGIGPLAPFRHHINPPAELPRPQPKKEEDDLLKSARRMADAINKAADSLDRTGADIVYRVEANKREAEGRAMAQERLAEVEKARLDRDSFRNLWRSHGMGQIGQITGIGGAGFDLMSALPMMVEGLGIESKRSAGLTFGLQMATGSPLVGQMLSSNLRGGGLQFPNEPNSTVAELAKELRDKFDPLNANGKLMSLKANLDKVKEFFPDIGPQMIAAHWRDAVRELADRVGAGGPTKLTDAVLAGSQEDARLLSNFMSGASRQTTDDLLKQIRDILAARLGGRLPEAPPPRPVIAVPGGG